MKVSTIRTEKILPSSCDLVSLLDASISSLSENEIVVITSKIVSLCEGSYVQIDGTDREELIIKESDYYLRANASKYGHHFTVAHNTLIGAAGIDESNGAGNYILLPKDSQKTANEIRRYLTQRFKLKNVGVIITDSTSQPLRLGTTGIALAHSGFKGINDYVGTKDLFGKSLSVTRANIAGGLAAAAVLVMGEGAEQTPLCIISETDFVQFQRKDPSSEELAEIYMTMEDDLFAPFLKRVPWEKGNKGRSQ